MRSWERTFFLLIVVVTLFAALGHFRAWRHQVPIDLRAFYCAGEVVAHHQDPYRVEPLLTCERNIAVADAADWHDYVDPVPLPGYDMIALSALASLPVHTATIVFGLLIFLSTVLTGYALSRLSPFPFPVAFLLAYFGMTYVGSSLGQVAPLAIASLALGALFLRRGKMEAAGLAACGALLQPQFALPSLVALFFFVPRTRLILVSVVTILGVGSFMVLGFHTVLEYFTVLQIHAGSELNWPSQYSFAWLVHALGGSPNFALNAGTISTIFLLFCCFFVLFRAREHVIGNGAVLLLPAAYAVTGGTFIHPYQVSVASLAALTILRPSPLFAMNPTFASALLLMPFAEMATREAHWPHPSTLPSIVVAIVAVWCSIYYPTRAVTERAARQHALLGTFLIVGIFIALISIRPVFTNVYPQLVHIPGALASIEWKHVTEAVGTQTPAPMFFLLAKLPTWCALAILLWSCTPSALGKKRTN